jgi:hypothetical protein
MKPKIVEVVKLFFEVHPSVYCIMHSTLVPYRERNKKLPTSGESKKEEEKKSKRGERGNSQNKACEITRKYVSYHIKLL